MKNAHGVEPTRFMKKKESKTAIRCVPIWGPLFGNNKGDILIADNCTKESNWINPPSCFQYDCHPQYRSSLYVNTSDPDHGNRFSVLDYEVYTYPNSN